MRAAKVLSVRQPWAWAIAEGHQRLITRDRDTGYRGTLLIVAPRRQPIDRDGVAELRRRGYGVPVDLPRGVIVGSVELIECLSSSVRLPLDLGQWAGPGISHWLFAMPRVAATPLRANTGLGLGQPPARWSDAFVTVPA